MAQPLVIEYTTDASSATKAVTAAVARLGYTLKSIDKENGLVTFETGASMKSWAGQSMSIHILEVDERKVQITIGGKRNVHGAQMQIYDWGESSGITAKVVQALAPILGEGEIVSGSLGSGGCFVATAIYGSYEHPSVLVLRQFRDDRLAPSIIGRILIRAYYLAGPSLARFVMTYPALNSICRKSIERFVLYLKAKNL